MYTYMYVRGTEGSRNMNVSVTSHHRYRIRKIDHITRYEKIPLSMILLFQICLSQPPSFYHFHDHFVCLRPEHTLNLSRAHCFP